jgi:hypothetical protein
LEEEKRAKQTQPQLNKSLDLMGKLNDFLKK